MKIIGSYRRKMSLVIRSALCLIAALSVHALTATENQRLAEDDFSYKSSFDGAEPLFVHAVYPADAKDLPLMVVQHGYWGKRQDVLYSQKRIAERGYFAIALDTRGWDKAGGKHDDGGVEIMDIYDGIQEALKKFKGKINPSRISIVGYSNGGANVFFSTVRMPFMFRASMAFFGIPDYGMWYELQQGFRGEMNKAIGGEPKALPDKYLARNSALAVKNIGQTRFHIVYDEEEKLCPIPMDDAFVEAAKKAGLKNVFVHVSKKTDKNRWNHGYNTNGHLSPAEDIFMDDIEKSNAAPQTMPPEGELVVLGFVVTPKFTCVLGSGEDTVATIKYAFRGEGAGLEFSTPVTSVKDAKVRLIIPADAFMGGAVAIIDGKEAASSKAGEDLAFETSVTKKIEIRPIK